MPNSSFREWIDKTFVRPMEMKFDVVDMREAFEAGQRATAQSKDRDGRCEECGASIPHGNDLCGDCADKIERGEA